MKPSKSQLFPLQLDPNDSVKVVARVRPLLDHERAQGVEETIEMSVDDPAELQVSWPALDYASSIFETLPLKP